MLILTSPAKTMNFESEVPKTDSSNPRFYEQTQDLISILKTWDIDTIRLRMSVSDTIAQRTYHQFQNWSFQIKSKQSKPAIFAYAGDVFRQLKLYEYSVQQMKYLNGSLRILSGLYGILCPLDLIHPYRLEMKTRIRTESIDHLGSFWAPKITEALNSDIENGDHSLVLNLASQEYSKAVDKEICSVPVIDVEFRQRKNGAEKMIPILAKRARGMMIEWCVQNNATTFEDLERFDMDGYSLSNRETNSLVFVRNHP